MAQIIHTPCTACFLQEKCYTVGFQTEPKPFAKLQIFLDYPSQEDDMRHAYGESRTAEFLAWLLARNSLKEEDYAINFTLKCNVPKQTLTKLVDKWECIDACSKHRFANLQKPPYTILTMGELSCLAFLHEAVAKKINCSWKSPEPELMQSKIFVSYAPGYGLASPAECVGISRMIHYAAEEAGLNPHINNKLKMFDFQVI